MERLSSRLESDYALLVKDEHLGERLSQALPGPLFRLGFTFEQAKHFEDAWSNPPLDTPESPTKLLFIVWDTEDGWFSRGIVPGKNDLVAVRV
jgi:hypothetical protein